MIGDDKSLVPTWYVPLQVALGLMQIALFFAGVAITDTVAWYQWFLLLGGFGYLGVAVYETLRARRRGRRW